MFTGQRRKRRIDPVPFMLLLAMTVLWTVIHLITQTDAFGHSPYDSYTLQAIAWRNGQTWIENRPYLELAVKDGLYYVSFPPVPSLVEWVLTFFFGAQTPDNLLVKIYSLFACIMMYRALEHVGYQKSNAALLAFFYAFASSLLPLTMNGAVWFHAQVLSFFLTTAAICLLIEEKLTLSLLCYALSVGCRPFQIIYIIPMAVIAFSCYGNDSMGRAGLLKKSWKGILCVVAVAGVMGLYNYLRFSSPLEFGHNYLPEFSTQGGTQFSPSHIPNNIKTFWFGLPFYIGQNGLEIKQFGFSMFIACPALIIMLIRFVMDLIRKKISMIHVVIIICFLLHMFLLLLHRTFGGYQYGSRYAVDLIPYTFLYSLLDKREREIPAWQIILFFLGFLLALYGSLFIHL